MNRALALQNNLSDWQARLELGFSSVTGRTILSHRARFGPLTVQRGFYPEGPVCHVYILHPPGGVVGGDQLHIDVEVEKDASALITNPGATKFYRSLGKTANLKTRLHVKGELEWMPQENILFRAAQVKQQTSIDVDDNARFIGWEIHCLGRPASNQIFDQGTVHAGFQINRNGRPVQIENMRITPQLGRLGTACLRGYPVTGVCYATPFDKTHLKQLHEYIEQSNDDSYLGITLLDDVLVARYLGNSSRDAQQRFVKLWQYVRPIVMSRQACIPRIWHT